ncbi:MAG: META domain-containing protein, partial [Longimicrobiales bacterium]|nr:META domain-containing protein [Longimicrobiales bacterium]
GMAISAEKVTAQSELDGAWEVTHALADSVESNQAGLYIFQGGYYSVLHVWNDEPRPLYEEGETRESIDHDKLLAIVLPVEGNSGRFEVEGSTLTMSPMVAISPNFMRGESKSYTFSISGDELTLRGGHIPGRYEEDRVITLRRLH